MSQVDERSANSRRRSRASSARGAHGETIAARAREFAPRLVVIAARGSSDNAARYAQYLFGAHNRLPVCLATPSLFTYYDAAPSLAGALVIGVSQSGSRPTSWPWWRRAADRGR